MALTVENLEEAKHTMKERGAHFIGDVIEIPGHVRLQSCVDLDGNRFQLAQSLDK